MAVTTLLPVNENKAGVVDFHGYKVQIQWNTSIPNDPHMKACTETVCAEAAKARGFTNCVIRSAPHPSSRIGGKFSRTYVKDDLHVTADFTKTRWGRSVGKPVTAHIYCGPKSTPQNYSETYIFREDGKPALVWFNDKNPRNNQTKPSTW
ncbi:hypothetical protein IFR04_006518 [Cadophora malorum]|uniref:Uncharacterized protein n=1 Tax=Cadophora malorum TaxID=108018 RepID=A0A8H7W9B9_9HELO|nr:hypothetical protein IFR04_006518 [Cadophora malorum]